MTLSDKQITYRDDLLYEYAVLTRVAFGESRSPGVDLSARNVCTVMQELVDEFRDDHPVANQKVRLGIGRDRPGRSR